MATDSKPQGRAQARSGRPEEESREPGASAGEPTASSEVASPQAAPESTTPESSVTGRTASPESAQPRDRTEGEAVRYRRPQYMISARSAPGFQPLSADFVAQQLKDNPEISFVKTIEPPRLLALQSAEGGGLKSLVLARMHPTKAQLLQTQAAGRLVVERDPPLTYALQQGPAEIHIPNPGVLVLHAEGFKATFEIRGDNGPLAGADVFVFGSVWPTQAVTDESGRVTISIVGESPETIRAVYVKPKADYWSLWVERPRLVPDSVNTLAVRPLGSTIADFPERQTFGWGERAMGLDAVPTSYNGAGVKVAVIDSGAAQTTHRNLRRVGPGVSIVGDDRGAWTTDSIGHGSHCAGVIGGGPVGSGIRGFAPAAEIHVCRIFPGGRFSDLVSALDYCMEQGIDVVNMSLGGGDPSQIVEERLIKAKSMGIACIVAAGNSGGPVQFPASTPHVLAVSAVGKWGEFPEDSYHAKQALEGFQSRDGYFPASFSCFGPEIDVCAPGVAIVSSLPPDEFGAWDGTSMAAPHVTGLAALVLAHHPDFKGSFRNRDARRVERLFQIIKESATPLQLGDPGRAGAGLPSIPRALGLAEPIATRLSASTLQVPEASIEALKELLGLLVGTTASASPSPSTVTSTGPTVAPGRQTEAMFSGAEATVARGPAYTGNGQSGLNWMSGNPDVNSLRTAMRQAGLLP